MLQVSDKDTRSFLRGYQFYFQGNTVSNVARNVKRNISLPVKFVFKRSMQKSSLRSIQVGSKLSASAKVQERNSYTGITYGPAKRTEVK